MKTEIKPQCYCTSQQMSLIMLPYRMYGYECVYAYFAGYVNSQSEFDTLTVYTLKLISTNIIQLCTLCVWCYIAFEWNLKYNDWKICNHKLIDVVCVWLYMWRKKNRMKKSTELMICSCSSSDCCTNWSELIYSIYSIYFEWQFIQFAHEILSDG